MALTPVGWVCAGPRAWLSTHPCHGNGKDRALSASARQMMTPCGTSRLPAVQRPFLCWNHSSPAQCGWMSTEQGWHLSLAGTKPSFPCFSPKAMLCTRWKPWSSHLTATEARSDCRRRVRMTDRAYIWMLSQERRVTTRPHGHCSLGKGISICTWPLGFLTPAALTTGAWNAAS